MPASPFLVLQEGASVGEALLNIVSNPISLLLLLCGAVLLLFTGLVGAYFGLGAAASLFTSDRAGRAQ